MRVTHGTAQYDNSHTSPLGMEEVLA